MKKLLFYALAAFTVMGAGCSKDVEGLDASVAEGKYTLPAITASLDDAETRSGLGTNNVVNWSNNDKLAIINKTTKTKYIYVLTSGAGTPVGKFEPVNTSNPATFSSLDDIKAVYPAIAASVNASGAISVSLNKEYTEEERAEVGITSWTANSSAYAFSNNDIKVSYKASADFTSGNSAIPVNFKFRQLATWCTFTFNFANTKDYEEDNMESYTITTTAGTKKISGTAEIDFTDPNQPVLKEGTETSVTVKTTGSLGSSFNKQLMLFPAIAGNDEKPADQLKVTIVGKDNTYTLFAELDNSLSGGTIVRFPFNIDDNFKKSESTGSSFTYNVVPNSTLPDFYYYGKANCILLAGSTATGTTVDITPHKTNTYYRRTGDAAPTAPKAASAKIIWCEAGITALNVAVDGTNLKITDAAGSGNALVGIYASDGTTLLWSFHIWKPEIDPSADENVLTYKYTNSGDYKVMPIALGATSTTTVAANGTATNDTNTKAMGLYYQWGRKDPLGRPSTITAGAEAPVLVYDAVNGGGSEVKLYQLETSLVTLLGGENIEEKDGLPADRYMIKYVTAHPTEFIVVPDGKYGNDWAGKTNDQLWGNPRGYNFPRKPDANTSIFDPCPAGYRVAPKDLWIAFTKSGNNTTAQTTPEESWAENVFNIMNRVANGTAWPTTKNQTSLTTQRGYFFCYETEANGTKKWQTGATDFYPASGYRHRTSGSLSSVGSGGWFWSSSPASAGSTSAGRLSFNASYVSPFNYDNRAYGFTVRCVRE